jgi:hypothetical protein
MKIRLGLVALVVLPVLAGSLLLAGRLSAGEAHRAKAAKFAEKLGYMDRLRAMVRKSVKTKQPGDAKSVDQAVAKVDMKPLVDFVVDHVEKNVDEATLDELLPYLETPEGAKQLKLMRAGGSLLSLDMLLVFTQATNSDELQKMDDAFKAAWDKSTSGIPEMNVAKNELAAIATLRNLTSCQAQIQTSGKIDCDDDGIGEFGTFLELTGAVGVRKFSATSATNDFYSDFSKQGTHVSPAILSQAFANVDENGVVKRRGYCFRIFLPDDANPSGFTGEKGPAEKVSLAGGTGRIYTDLAEQVWCVYAWPEEQGVTGNRVFFVNQAADVIQSANTVAKWSGTARMPKGNSAFQATSGGGITGRIAIGVAGADGDVWKITN